MAALSYYLQDAATSGAGNAAGWEAIDTATVGAATLATGWVVGTGSTNHSELASRAERASATFTGTTVPDGTLDTTLKDAFRSVSALTGNFASANWVFDFVVQSPTNGGAADGRIRFRIIRADADGANAVEITSAQQQASLLTNVTTSDADSTLTVNPGAFSITNQYLFIQIAWERTGAGGMTTTNIRFRSGSATTTGTRLTTSSFSPTHPTTGALTGASSTVVGSAAHKAKHTTTGALTGAGSTVVGSAARTRRHATTGALTGAGSTVVGTARRMRAHANTGALAGPGATVAGVAARTRLHASTGALAAGGSAVSGSADRQPAGAVVTPDAPVVSREGGGGPPPWPRKRKRLNIKVPPELAALLKSNAHLRAEERRRKAALLELL